MTEASPEEREVVAAFARWAAAVDSGDQAAARRFAEEALALARSRNSPFLAVAEVLVEEAGAAITRTPRGTPSYSCSFCGALDGDGKRLVAGPAVFICKSCVDSRAQQLASSGPTSHKNDASSVVSTTPRGQSCAFCNRPPSDGATMLVADAHFLCDGCLRICVEIFASKG